MYRYDSRSLLSKAVIGLDDAKIGKLIKPMWTKDRGRFVVNDGAFEVLTNAYLGSLACEADETAAKLGRVTLKRLASTFKLPIEVTRFGGLCTVGARRTWHSSGERECKWCSKPAAGLPLGGRTGEHEAGETISPLELLAMT